MKIEIDIAAKTDCGNAVKIKDIFFNRKKMMKKYPKTANRSPFFVIDTRLLFIRINEINGDDLYIIKN